MGFIFHFKNIVNDYEKYKNTKSPKLMPKELPNKKLPNKESPRMKKRIKSMDDFAKFQWSWTL
tara:strand:+ start:1234 stop:1422 length:189 start_codon:yes stop_codon:yes gene_type:complete